MADGGARLGQVDGDDVKSRCRVVGVLVQVGFGDFDNCACLADVTHASGCPNCGVVAVLTSTKIRALFFSAMRSISPPKARNLRARMR